jgi:hypothetical protein
MFTTTKKKRGLLPPRQHNYLSVMNVANIEQFGSSSNAPDRILGLNLGWDTDYRD